MIIQIIAILIGLGIYGVAESYDSNHGFSKKWWKGYWMGILYFSPLIIFLIISSLTP